MVGSNDSMPRAAIRRMRKIRLSKAIGKEMELVPRHPNSASDKGCAADNHKTNCYAIDPEYTTWAQHTWL
jgi:hypothetical protein